MKNVGILTGGGDAPGLNAVIRAVVIRLARERKDYNVIGLIDGWAGLRDKNTTKLSPTAVDEILHQGGTILGTSRTNLYKKGKEGDIQKAIEAYHQLNLDALVAIGGDDTLEIAYYLGRDHKLNIVGVPKTIDNDVCGTDFTFGFWSSVEQATKAIDDLRVTTMSHHRVMVIECMGRHAGWITAYTGLASEADYIAVPEKAVHIDVIANEVKNCRVAGKLHSIIVVAEGASIAGIDVKPRVVKNEGGEWAMSSTVEKDNFGNVILRPGEVGEAVAAAIEQKTGFETRAIALGHLQRGGSPCAYDRILGTRYGVKAAEAVIEGNFGSMVVMSGLEVFTRPMSGLVRESQSEHKKYKLLPDDFLKIVEVFYE
ncbi:MAG TPA: ATP-dependent 6-phosphofructokinase [Planctomycetota bacterium]|nr:ATP-dependent 6-phosphofructokinase [Planctomycetota bacterium]